MDTQTGTPRMGQFGAGLLIARPWLARLLDRHSKAASLPAASPNSDWSSWRLRQSAPVSWPWLVRRGPPTWPPLLSREPMAWYWLGPSSSCVRGSSLPSRTTPGRRRLPVLGILLASVVGRISVLNQRKEAALRAIPEAKPLGPGMNARGQALAGHKCASCDRPLSPVWVGQCQHCGAKYAEFPPAPRTQ